MPTMASTLKDQINLRQTSSHSYTASYHHDWATAIVLLGGAVAATIYHAAKTHLATTLKAQDQPDVLTLHLEFFRPCQLCESTISVVDLKVGAATSTLQLQLSQEGRLKVLALATSINFDKPLGPSVPFGPGLHPPPKPIPDFAKVLAHQPEDHWLPAHLSGEILPFTRRMLMLNPREGFPVDGVCDAWHTIQGAERMDDTYLPMLADFIPSMSDTLLHARGDRGVFDARAWFDDMKQWAEKHPGIPAELTNSIEAASKAEVFENTVTQNLEFKRKVPEGGLDWAFTRTSSQSFINGRLDIDVTVCDQNMELLCLSHQVVLALDGKRKFYRRRDAKPAL